MMDSFDPDSVSKLNPRRIYELARDHPIIAIVLNSWEQGYYYSWEQMLIHCITVLVETNERLKQDNIELRSKRVQPIIVEFQGKRGNLINRGDKHGLADE